jgi:hypothetical protein
MLVTQSCQKQEFDELNILKNSGFEEANDGVPGNWERRTELAEGSRIYTDTQVAYSGRNSLCIEVSSDQAGESLSFSLQVVDEIPSGARLSLTGVIKTENLAEGAVVSLVARSLDSDDQLKGFASTERTQTFTGTNDWTKVETRFLIPANTARLEIWTLLSGTGKVWFDDVQLIHEVPVEES